MPSQTLRGRVATIARQHVLRGDATGWFDEVYRQAEGDIDKVPWAAGTPNEWLVRWLAEQVVDPGNRAVVSGCGLGDDGEALAAFGYEVTAFDVSKHCVSWCRKRFDGSPVSYDEADLLDVPQDWRASFDLVFDGFTLQSLPLALRPAALEALVGLAAPGGRLLLICDARADGAEPAGPPWPVSRLDLEVLEERGLRLNRFEDFVAAEQRMFVAEYQRPGGATLPVPPSMDHWGAFSER